MKAVICMPEHTPMIKVDGTLKYGAEVVLYGASFDECKDHALKLAEENGYTFIPPFDDLDVIEGQGTIGLEIVEELKYVDYVLVPVGGGGLISGVAKCLKQISPLIKVIGVEPYSARSMKEAIKQGHIVTLDGVDTIADGTAVATVGNANYEICKDNVDDWITVTDEEILMSFISQLINRGLYETGRIMRIEVEIANIPGKLQALLTEIANTKANVISIEHDGFKEASRFKNISVQLTLETNGMEHAKKIREVIAKKGYIIH